MTCPQLINSRAPAIRIDINRYDALHADGRRLISGWFDRAWQLRDCTGDDCFEAFIFAWFAVNGWAACVTEADEDWVFINALIQDPTLCKRFEELRRQQPEFQVSVEQFAALWPIFEVKTLRRLGLYPIQNHDRAHTVELYLGQNANRFEPQCWQRHREAGTNVPFDWPHTLRTIYRVRCNLFHGEKAAHSEMDQRIVRCAFSTLITFFRMAKLL